MHMSYSTVSVRMALSNLAKFSTTRSARGLSATDQLLVSTKFRGVSLAVRVRSLNETGAAFLPLDAVCELLSLTLSMSIGYFSS